MANEILINFMINLNHKGPLDITHNIIDLIVSRGLITEVEGKCFMTYVTENCNMENPTLGGLGGGTIEGYIAFASNFNSA